MKFGEFLGLAVELAQGFFGWNVIFTGVDEVSEDADQDERADKGGVKDAPEDNTGDSRTEDD